MQNFYYIVILALVAWFMYKLFAPVKGLKTLNVDQFKKEIKGHYLIDVREAHEYKQGNIKGSVNISISQLQQQLTKIPKDQPVYLYCRSGMRSKQAGKILSRNGYRDIAHLNGGIMAWNQNR